MIAMRTALAALAILVAACGDSSSGNAFCDDYGGKISALGCSKGQDKGTLAGDCALVLDAESKCATQYKAILSCQETTSTCGSSGDIQFGDCASQTEAYSTCKSG